MLLGRDIHLPNAPGFSRRLHDLKNLPMKIVSRNFVKTDIVHAAKNPNHWVKPEKETHAIMLLISPVLGPIMTPVLGLSDTIFTGAHRS